MIQGPETFPAKIMLFGEYSILLGSPALSIPFTHFSAILKISGKGEENISLKSRESNRMLREFFESALSKHDIFSRLLDMERLYSDLTNGLWLDSTIPSRYGAGSSGALCAAIYQKYAYEPAGQGSRVDPEEMVNLRQIFISMESWFHGRSSGLDPLVIYFRFPLFIDENGGISAVTLPADLPGNKAKIFLVDTARVTGTFTLVPLFLKHYSPGGDKEKEGIQLCELNRSCIAYFCKNDASGFRENLRSLSEFQFHNLSAMIPDPMRPVWSEGLDSGLFYFKLCGSGGGGFLTGFTSDYEVTVKYFKHQNIHVIPVNFL